MIAGTLNSRTLAHSFLGITLCFILGCPLSPRSAYGQATQKVHGLDDAIARVTSGGDVNPRDVEVIAKAGAVRAIPALEEQFRLAKDIDTKLDIASGLVRLKEHDDTYWKFLLQQATLAVDSNVPDSVYSESQAKVVIPNPELQTWADAHRVSVNTAGQYARYDYPATMLRFASTGDPRGISLLQRALHCRNYLIAVWAAKGLAQLQDKPSIPIIIAAAREAPAGYGSAIAESLIYFDDVAAQRAFDTYVTKDGAKMWRDARARGQGAFGW